MSYEIISMHNHTFLTDKHVPKNFIPFVTRWLSKSRHTAKLAPVVNKMTFWSSNSRLDRIMVFLKMGNLKTQQEVFERMIGFYPDSARFVDLAMDMEYMGAGKVKQEYGDQLRELAEMKKKYGDKILVFPCVDPRRKNAIMLIDSLFEKDGPISGIKLYPALGYYPQDLRLDEMYEYAQEKNLPIIAHCGIDGAVHMRGKRKIKKLLSHSHRMNKRYKNLWNNFTDPKNYHEVLAKFPKLKICLAHMGGGDEVWRWLNTSAAKKDRSTWFGDIMDMIKEYPENIYTDTSFTMHDNDLHGVLKMMLKDEGLRNNILYGTDFYMDVQEEAERKFGIDLWSNIGEDNFKQIAHTNPKRFLGIE